MKSSFFAAFVLAPLPGTPRKFAATTRAADRGELGRIGLPGGKIDPGESAVDAVIREAKEEGWEVLDLDLNPIHCQLVDDKPVVWFRARTARPIYDYKEKNRIHHFFATKQEVLSSGYGNENLNDIIFT